MVLEIDTVVISYEKARIIVSGTLVPNLVIVLGE